MHKLQSKDGHNHSLTNGKHQYSESQKLLVLQNRQIVRHMISLRDWIILCIFTPKQTSSKQYHNQAKDITEFVSVLAIRTQQKSQGNQNQRKECIGQIKMLHKECRVQNLLEWKYDNKIQSLQQEESNKHFLILSYTKIQLYTISSSTPSTISLSKTFSTPFLIPFNVIRLNNHKKELLEKQKENSNANIGKEHVNQMKRLLFDDSGKKQEYAIGMVGIDRSQTFWSGYYQIQPIKRHLYLFKEDFIDLNLNKSSTKLQDVQQSNSSRKLRRVKSAQNVFNLENQNDSKGSISSNNNAMRKKQELSCTQVYTRRESTLVEENERKFFTSPSNKPEQQSFSKTSTKERLKFLKQPSPQEFISTRNSKLQPKSNKDQIPQKTLPTQILFSKKLQLYPSLIAQQSKSSSPFKKNRPSSPKYGENLFITYNHGSSKCHPPVEHVHHFYSEKLVEIKQMVRKEVLTKQEGDMKKNRKKFRKEYELMVLVAYFSSVVLINVAQQETISKLVLQQTSFIRKTLQIDNIFGMFSSILLTKSHNSNTKPLTKLIKLTVDTINHEQLGIGLQPIKLSSFQGEKKEEHVVDCFRVIDDVAALNEEVMRVQEYARWLTEKDQDEIKQPYDEVRELIVEENQKMESVKKDQIKEEEDIQQSKSILSYTKELTSWLSSPISQLQYSVLIIKNSGRILLFNHLTSSIKQLYPSSLPSPIHSANYLAINPLHIDSPSIIPRLALKIGMIYSTNINQSMSKWNSQNNDTSSKNINLIQQLKQITFA